VQHENALAAIRGDLTHAQVARLFSAISARMSILRDLQTAQVTVGADIVIELKISGAAYLQGLSGTVQAIYDDKYSDVLLDERSTKALTTGRGKTAYPMEEGTTRYLLTGMPIRAFAVTTPDAKFTEVLQFILGNATKTELDELNAARTQRRTQFAADLANGDTVMLTDTKRQYLQGLSGVVQSVDHPKKQFSLLLDERSTERLRFHSRNHSIDIPAGVTQYLFPRISIECALVTSSH
jgi:hypothetical protein